MKYEVNSYLAVLLITAVGAGAAFTIVRVSTDMVTTRIVQDTDAANMQLEQSILQNR
ncbi:MAG TPA: hypothetical protein VFP46_01280 [Candidatus Paceibacterota bacterium]|nr:hypothetical protein [Candidatus Paceibacterota bacterium]